MIMIDIATAQVGTTSLTLRACNIGGCSSTVPFGFGKQLPSVPSQLRLVP
jgi:hypothetical protein